jgi:hypothetical protein
MIEAGRHMVQQTIRKAPSWNSPAREHGSSFASRPFGVQAQQNSRERLTQGATDTENSDESVERAALFGHNFADIAIHSHDHEVSAPVQPKLAMPPLGHISEAITDNRATEMQPENKTGLLDHLKAGIESLSGLALDAVRVHFNSDKPAQLQALAYTQGTEIHVAAGQERHLAHEAWHVVQQAQGRVRPTMQLKDGVEVNDDRVLEQEADVMGARATVIGHPAVASRIIVSRAERAAARPQRKPFSDQGEKERLNSLPPGGAAGPGALAEVALQRMAVIQLMSEAEWLQLRALIAAALAQNGLAADAENVQRVINAVAPAQMLVRVNPLYEAQARLAPARPEPAPQFQETWWRAHTIILHMAALRIAAPAAPVAPAVAAAAAPATAAPSQMDDAARLAWRAARFGGGAAAEVAARQDNEADGTRMGLAARNATINFVGDRVGAHLQGTKT